jgi:hypothetical protein
LIFRVVVDRSCLYHTSHYDLGCLRCRPRSFKPRLPAGLPGFWPAAAALCHGERLLCFACGLAAQLEVGIGTVFPMIFPIELFKLIQIYFKHSKIHRNFKYF